MTNEIKKEKLNEEQLEEVSGGGFWSADPYYASGDTPAFTIGEKVFMVISSITKRKAVIIDINKDENGKYKKYGMFNREFIYTIRYENGETEDDVYESQLCKA